MSQRTVNVIVVIAIVLLNLYFMSDGKSGSGRYQNDYQEPEQVEYENR
jgi:hypothetical protein